MVLLMIKEIDLLCQQMVQLLDLDQTLPIYADKPFISNTFNQVFINLLNENVSWCKKIFYLATINGLNDDDVRLSKRKI